MEGVNCRFIRIDLPRACRPHCSGTGSVAVRHADTPIIATVASVGHSHPAGHCPLDQVATLIFSRPIDVKVATS
jgi:hypothetical protein